MVEAWKVRSEQYGRAIFTPTVSHILTTWSASDRWPSDYWPRTDARGRLMPTFVFSGVCGGSSFAAMRPLIARSDYLMETIDLQQLPRILEKRRTFYRFEDVVCAGFHKFGSPADYLARLIGKLERRVARSVLREKRVGAIESMLLKDFPARPDPSSLRRYVEDFIVSGRGGVKTIKERCTRHARFDFLVSRNLGNGPSLNEKELESVRYFRIRYALNLDDQMLVLAVARIVRSRQILAGA